MTARNIWDWVRRVFTWFLLLACLLILAVTVVIPRVTGAVPYTILTSSMEPTYPPGTLVVVKKPDSSTIGVGTAVTYQLNSGEPEVVTHRVVAVNTGTDGRRTYITQGDHNNTPDAKPVMPEQIRGQVWYAVPYMGYLNTWLTGKQHTVVFFVVIAALLTYAVYMFVSGTRESRAKKKQVTSEHA